MLKFYGTIEFLSGQKAAILTLTNEAGEWAGSGRIEVRSGLKSDLYEEAYRQASLNAHSKGGRLERFSVEDGGAQETWDARLESCRSRIVPTLERRPANALNVEIGQPVARCLNRKPEHWPASVSALRWIGSGGGALVFGHCSWAHCPDRAR